MPSSQSLISIIVPCYNQAEHLDECLQSVLEQTFTDWECIIVNDGSPDNTEEVAKKWTEKDARFTYLKKENGGLSSARNAGIEIANGEWILPLDADDKIAKQYLEFSLIEIQKGYDLIYSRLELFGSQNKELKVNPFDYPKLLFVNPFYCSCIYPKQKWQKIGGYDENLKAGLEDWEFWINMVYNTDTKVVKIDYIGFFYRRKIESMNTLMNSDKAKQLNAKTYIVQKHAHHYAKAQDWINELAEEKEKYINAFELIKKSRIIKLVQKMGFLKWISRI